MATDLGDFMSFLCLENLKLSPVQTRILRKSESLSYFIIESVPKNLICEKMILAVTSKIFSLAENRLVPMDSISKQDLIDKEADHNLGEVGYGCYLTIKEGLFIASAGIDESNSEGGDYILYPEDPFASCKELYLELKEAWKLKELGILMTDSHTTPLRRGVTGISLAHWGFRGLQSAIGKPDLFGREMKMTTINFADGLAAAATMVMGEAREARPLAILNAEGIEFVSETDRNELKMPTQDDLYYPFFKALL